MRLEKTHRNIQSQGVLEEAQFGISTKDQSHVLSILRDKLYSDKILAVLREYSTNAVDAHVEVGKSDLPIKVILPTRMAPYLIIRDHGPGLSQEEIFQIYIQYGASTKRQSNDVIGQLGLGCKSAFAYTDSFTITSYQGGRQSIYHAFIDESNMGKVVKLSDEQTGEADGIEIKIAVNTKDVNSFKEKARNLFKYFNVRPNCSAISYEEEKKVLEGTGWYIPENNRYGYDNRKAIIVMGNIPYPLNKDLLIGKLEGDKRRQKVKSLLETHIVMKARIGNLSISASRESLEYTDQTVENIVNQVVAIYDEMSQKVSQAITSCKTPYEAVHQFSKLKGSLPYSLQDSVRPHWNGKKIETKFDFKKEASDVPSRFKKIRSGWTKSSEISQSSVIQIESLGAIYIKDTNVAPIQRSLDLRRSQNLGTILIYIPTVQKDKVVGKAEVDAFLKRNDAEGCPIYFLSDVPYTPKRVAGTGKGKAHGKADKGKVFEFVPGYGKQRFQQWKKSDAVLGDMNCIYVLIDRFSPVRSGFRDNDALNDAWVGLGKLGVAPDKLVAVRIRDKKRIPDTWVKLSDYCKMVIKVAIKKHASKLKYVDHIERLKYVLPLYTHDDPTGKHLEAQSWPLLTKSALGKVLKSIYVITERSRTQHYKGMREGIKILDNLLGDISSFKDTGTTAVKRKVDKMNKQYPLMRHAQIGKDSVNAIIKYAELIDKDLRENDGQTTANHDG